MVLTAVAVAEAEAVVAVQMLEAETLSTQTGMEAVTAAVVVLPYVAAMVAVVTESVDTITLAAVRLLLADKKAVACLVTGNALAVASPSALVLHRADSQAVACLAKSNILASARPSAKAAFFAETA